MHNWAAIYICIVRWSIATYKLNAIQCAFPIVFNNLTFNCIQSLNLIKKDLKQATLKTFGSCTVIQKCVSLTPHPLSVWHL